MAWPLVVVGIMLGIMMIMARVKSPMLVAVGMYLPFNTTSAIFLGGVIRWFVDTQKVRRGFNEAQRARIENVGVLAAAGMIAGEALMGLVVATFRFFSWPLPVLFREPAYWGGAIALIALAVVLVQLPLSQAGDPNEPAPPVAMM
jgi:uncharacterized oligopeptide transporter (OPT) family protein